MSDKYFVPIFQLNYCFDPEKALLEKDEMHNEYHLDFLPFESINELIVKMMFTSCSQALYGLRDCIMYGRITYREKDHGNAFLGVNTIYLNEGEFERFMLKNNRIYAKFKGNKKHIIGLIMDNEEIMNLQGVN